MSLKELKLEKIREFSNKLEKITSLNLQLRKSQEKNIKETKNIEIQVEIHIHGPQSLMIWYTMNMYNYDFSIYKETDYPANVFNFTMSLSQQKYGRSVISRSW